MLELLRCWEVSDLRAQLKKLGQSTAGRKAELIERIKARAEVKRGCGLGVG